MPHDIRSRLRRGERLLGTMITLPEPATAELLADLGFDWFFVDAEHGPLETRELAAILRAVGDRPSCRPSALSCSGSRYVCRLAA